MNLFNYRIQLAITACISGFVGMSSNLMLSAWTFEITKSYFLSSAVFGAQWVLPLLWPAGVSKLTKHKEPLVIAMRSEGFSIILTLLQLISVVQITPVIIIVIAIGKGFLENITRSASMLAIRYIAISSQEAEISVSNVEMWRVIGTTTAGIAYGLIFFKMEISYFLLISSIGYLLTTLIFRQYVTNNSITKMHFNSMHETCNLSTIKILRSNPKAAQWLLLLGVVAAYQGIHNAIRVSYPTDQLGMGSSGIGVVSAVSTIGVVCGAWIANQRTVIIFLKQVSGVFLIAVVGGMGIFAASTHNITISLLLYFLFMLSFEILFMYFQSRFVGEIEKKHANSLIGFRTTILSFGALFGLGLTSVLLNKLITPFSMGIAVLILVSFSILCSSSLFRLDK